MRRTRWRRATRTRGKIAKPTRRRAYIYLTRRRQGGLEVAVFRHPDSENMTLGQQVPGGTIELHETPEAGARREAFEESGLGDFLEVRFLTTDVRSYAATVTDTAEVTERFFFQFKVQKGVSDAWEHTVSDGELDKGMIFSYRWLPVAAAQSILSHMGDYLQLLE